MNKRILEIRKLANLTQEQFAKEMGISANYVNLIENGKKNPGDRLISDICRKYNINKEWLLYGTGNRDAIQDDEYTKIMVAIDKGDIKARQAILDYWKLSPEDKEIFWKFADKFLKGGT